MNPNPLHRLRLRLLAPTVALIVAATMVPTGLRQFSLRYVEYNFDPTDFLNNILLYLPLGFAMSSSPLWVTCLSGFLLSTAAELLQLGYVGRVPSPMDVASNTCGVVLGWLVARVWLRMTGHDAKSIPVPRPVAVVAILFALAGTATLVRHPPVPDFSNWNPDFHLAVGNELSGDRPWNGTVSNFAIYPFAMAPTQISDLARTDGSSTGLPPGGTSPPQDFAEHAGQPLLSSQDERKMFDSLVSRSQLTLLVWMRTPDVQQAGPARIVTYSQDGYQRNFTLGQVRNALTFRLRTPASGGNGTEPALYSGPVLSVNQPTFVAAVYDGRFSALYVNGKRVAQVDLTARTPHLPRRIRPWLPNELPIRQIELGGMEMLLSGLFTLGVFAFAGVPPGIQRRLLLGLLGGALIGGITWIFGISATRLGMKILLECMAAGLVIAASVEEQATNVS